MNFDLRTTACQELVQALLREFGGCFLRVVREWDAADQLGLQGADILHDFAIFLLRKDCKQLRLYEGRGGASPATYSTTIFSRWLSRELKRKRPDLELSEPNDLEGHADQNRNTEPTPVVRALHQCIKELRSDWRDALLDRLDRRMMLSEIARARGIDDIYELYRRILRALRVCLTARGFTFGDVADTV